MVTAPWCVIEAERQGGYYEQEQWKKRAGYLDPNLSEERLHEMRMRRGAETATFVGLVRSMVVYF